MNGERTAQMRGVAALGSLALVFRVYSLAVIDWPGACSAGWLSAVLGALLALPVALPFALREKGCALTRRAWPARAACGLIFAMALYDAAVSARLFAVLATYVALPDHSAGALSLPVIAVATVVCVMGAGAMSASAVVWRRVALALGGVAVLVQLRELRPGWLFPLLGEGPANVAQGAQRAAGHMALMALGVNLLGEGGRAERLRAVKSLGLAAAVCTGAVLMSGMLIPAMPDAPSDRLFRLEMLADCGQNGFATEVIYVLMMAGGMLLAGFELMTASTALGVLIPGLPGAACAVVCGAAAALLCLSPASTERWAMACGAWYYPAALAAAALTHMPLGRREAAR